MNRFSKLATTSLAVVAAGLAGFAASERGVELPWLTEVARSLGETSSADAMAPGPAASEKRILYYRNPMGLPDTSPVPKQDSMGMDYLPVYEGEETDGGSIAVSPGRVQRTGVRSTEAVLAPVVATLRAPGVVTLDERRVSIIATRADAFVETVADVTSGSTVVAGGPLVTLYSPEISQASAQFVADLRSGRTQADGSRQRLVNLGVPAEAIDRIAAEGKPSVSIAITAPRAGIVLERMAVEGMMARAGETLFRIADLSQVWVIAEVPEATLMEVKPGAEVRVRFNGLVEAMTGRIDTIYPEVSMATRTGKLRIELPNPEGMLKTNMYAEVEVVLSGPPVVQVPDGAVIDTGDRQVVLLDLGDGRFKPQDVSIGRKGAGVVEVTEGLAAGDRVVSTATFLIDAESNLKAALSALTASEAQP